MKIYILVTLDDFQKCIPVSGYKIYIWMRYVEFQKCIPVSGYKDIYFDKVRCFPDIFYLISGYINIYFDEEV